MSQNTPTKRRRGRPPKGQVDYSRTREDLLRSGTELLTEKGYSATGIDEILRRVGVPKGSFYHYFSSKDDFVSELIRQYASFFRHKLDKHLQNENLSPLERLVGFLEDATGGMARYDFRRGCLVGNLGQEMNALHEAFTDQINTVFADWQGQVEQCLKAAKQEGQIASTTDCAEAAYVFWVGWEGAVLRAKLERSPNALQAFTRFFLCSIQ